MTLNSNLSQIYTKNIQSNNIETKNDMKNEIKHEMKNEKNEIKSEVALSISIHRCLLFLRVNQLDDQRV